MNEIDEESPDSFGGVISIGLYTLAVWGLAYGSIKLAQLGNYLWGLS